MVAVEVVVVVVVMVVIMVAVVMVVAVALVVVVLVLNEYLFAHYTLCPPPSKLWSVKYPHTVYIVTLWFSLLLQEM